MDEPRFDARRLQDLMDRRGVSDYQVAERSGISRTMIYYLRKGKRKSASAEVMTKLADALETTVDYFIGADAGGRVTVTVPEMVRQLTEIANRLSAMRQEELVRIAGALEQLEREQPLQAVTQRQLLDLLAVAEQLMDRQPSDDPLDSLEALARALPGLTQTAHNPRQQ